MRIKYIGGKPNKADNVAGTGLAWTPGQVHDVADIEACRKLLAHSGVWIVEDVEARDAAKQEAHRAEVAARLEREEAERREAEEKRQREEAEREKAERDALLKAAAEAEAERAAAERAAAEKAEFERKEAEAAAAQAPAQQPPASLSSTKAPGDMTLDELKAFCAAKSLKFHPNIGRETLLERLVAHAEGAQS